MSAIQAAKLYISGQKMVADARQLSNKNLAAKFERSVRAISKVINHMPCKVPADEQVLIRQCASERDRLKSEASKLTIARLCWRFRVTYKQIETELIALGEWEAAA